MNLDEDNMHCIAHHFCCPVGSFPLKYLGALLHYEELGREDIQPSIDNILKRIAGWRGRLLSHARLVAQSTFYLLLSFISRLLLE